MDYPSLRWREKLISRVKFRREKGLTVQVFRNNSAHPWILSFKRLWSPWFIQTWDLSFQVLFKDFSRKNCILQGLVFHSIWHTCNQPLNWVNSNDFLYGMFCKETCNTNRKLPLKNQNTNLRKCFDCVYSFSFSSLEFKLDCFASASHFLSAISEHSRPVTPLTQCFSLVCFQCTRPAFVLRVTFPLFIA